MNGTHRRPALANHRDAVTELVRAGETFGDIEDAIDEVAGLTTDEKAALWLYGYSLRAGAERPDDARDRLAALQRGAAE